MILKQMKTKKHQQRNRKSHEKIKDKKENQVELLELKNTITEIL